MTNDADTIQFTAGSHGDAAKVTARPKSDAEALVERYARMTWYHMSSGYGLNPSAPVNAIDDYGTNGTSIIVILVDGKPRAFTTYGDVPSGLVCKELKMVPSTRPGSIPKRAWVSAIRHADGRVTGELPNRKLTHWVAK